jgi:hypothetical protein
VHRLVLPLDILSRASALRPIFDLSRSLGSRFGFSSSPIAFASSALLSQPRAYLIAHRLPPFDSLLLRTAIHIAYESSFYQPNLYQSTFNLWPLDE